MSRTSRQRCSDDARQEMSSDIAGSAARQLPMHPEGAIAQLGERVLCKHEVVGSIPSGSTRMPSASEKVFCRWAIGSFGELSDIVKR